MSTSSQDIKWQRYKMANIDLSIDNPIICKTSEAEVTTTNLPKGNIAIENVDGKLKIYGNVSGTEIVETSSNNGTPIYEFNTNQSNFAGEYLGGLCYANTQSNIYEFLNSIGTETPFILKVNIGAEKSFSALMTNTNSSNVPESPDYTENEYMYSGVFSNNVVNSNEYFTSAPPIGYELSLLVSQVNSFIILHTSALTLLSDQVGTNKLDISTFKSDLDVVKANINDVVANQLQTLRITFSDLASTITNEGSFTFTTGLPGESTQYNSILSKGTYILECIQPNGGILIDDSVSCIVSGKSSIHESGVLYVQRGVLNYQDTAYNVSVITNGSQNPGGGKIIMSIVVSFSKVVSIPETVPVVAFNIQTLVNNYDKMSGDTEEPAQEVWDTVKGKKQFIGNINIQKTQYGTLTQLVSYSKSILFCDEDNTIIVGGYHTVYTGYSNNQKYVLTFQNSGENNENVNLVVTDTDYILGTIYVKFDGDVGASTIKGVFGSDKQNLSTSDFTKTWSGGVLKIAIANKRYSLCASITFVQATYIGDISIAPSKPLYANVLSDGSIEIRGDISNDYGACITIFKYAGTY